MLRYTIICLALLGLSAGTPVANDRRSVRSIWPFGSSLQVSTEAPLLSEENALFLEQAGLGKNFNLSSHPLWKIHKYQGIDLKPVHVRTEIVASQPEDEETITTTEAVDLSFLDDLGGLAYFLPEPEDDDEATDLIAEAIKDEEEKQPGFFKRIWEKIWGRPSGFFSSMLGFGQSRGVEVDKRKPENTSDDSLTIYLPETQGSYVAVVVPPTEKTELIEEVPSNHASQFRENVGATPVAARPGNTRSQAWIQSWTPHASYSVHIQNEAANSSHNDLEPSDANSTVVFERKIGQEESTESPEERQIKQDEDNVERAKNILSSFQLPEGLLKKLQVRQQDVDEILNDKESAARAAERLRALQKEFEMRKEQLSYGSYSRVRKQN